MRQIFVLIAHTVFAVLFFWNTYMFWQVPEDVLGRYVNLIAALLAIISGLIYYLMSKRRKSKTRQQSG